MQVRGGTRARPPGRIQDANKGCTVTPGARELESTECARRHSQTYDNHVTPLACMKNGGERRGTDAARQREHVE